MLKFGFTLLKTITMVFLTTTTLIGFISWYNSKTNVDKLRFSFLTIGSLLSLIFTSNV